MTRNMRGVQPQMSASWASSIDGWAEDVQSVDSEEGHEPVSPQPQLSASQVGRLREAIGDEHENRVWSSPESVRQDRRTHVRDSVYEESPRRRNGRPAQATGSEFIMPSVNSLPPQDRDRNLRSSQQYPRAFWRDDKRRTYNAKMKASYAKRDESKAEPNNEDGGPDYLGLVWGQFLGPTLQFAASVLLTAFHIAKPFIKYGLALWLLVGAFITLRNFATTSVMTALTPICRIPGSSLLSLPFCESYNHAITPKGPVEFDKLVATQSAIEDVFVTSVGGGALPMAMKHSELSVRDLKTVVEHSKLPSRNELVFEFTGFIETARLASRSLSRYNTRIGKTVDSILTTSRWTRQVIEGIADDEAHIGAIPRIIKSVNIFAPFFPAQKMTQELLLERYLLHTASIQDALSILISEAVALLSVLDNLDERLDVIHSIAVRDNTKIQGDKDELLASLWTSLGGNQNSVARTNDKLRLLKDVYMYRKAAAAHVTGTFVKLEAIQSNLEDLRDRVAQPEVLGKDVLPLEMHIQHIQLGVERLEKIREEGRQVENKRIQSVLERGEQLEIEG